MYRRFTSIRIESLDALRGLLAVSVLVAHAWQSFVYPYENGISTTYFILGVIARGAVLGFFCLSGYVISLSIEKNILRNTKFIISDYFSARFWRIAPPLFVVIFLTLIMSLGLDFIGANKIPNHVLAARYIYETNLSSQIVCLISACAFGDLTGKGFNGPLWSLVYEIQLYAISGILTLFIMSTDRFLYRVFMIIFLIMYVFRVLKFHHGFIFNAQIVSYLCYLFGSLVYLNYHKLSKTAVTCLLILLIFFAIIIGFHATSEGALANMDSKNWLLFQAVLGAIFSFGLVAIAKFNVLHKFESLGKFSYTLYIFHFPLLMMIYFLLFTFTPNFLSNYYFFIFMIAVLTISFLCKKLGLFLEQAKAQRNFFRENVIKYFKNAD